MTTGCDPCKITVRPPRIGHVFEYVRPGFNPELKKPYGLVVKPGNFGSVIETCQISAFGVAGQGPPPVPVTVVSIEALATTDIVTICFDQELDATCSFTDGVTITVAGTPVGLVGATSDGSSDPWCYDYEIDTTINIDEAVIWDYDAGVGEICSSTTTLGSTTETTTAVCDSTYGDSSLVSWNAGADSPTIDFAEYSSALSAVSVHDSSASVIDTIQTDTGKYYAEFQVLDEGTGTGTSILAFGWKRQASVTNTGDGLGVIASYSESSAIWEINREMLGNNQFSFDPQPSAPSACTVVGVAIDADNEKCYVLIDGVWMVSTGPTQGGDPSGGNGWPITNANQIAVLWSATSFQNATNIARSPEYTPSGYTPVT